MKINLLWFKANYSYLLNQFHVEYRIIEKADFGMLEEIVFTNDFLGGYLHFWENGFIELMLYDYAIDKIVFNEFIENESNDKKLDAINQIMAIIKKLSDNRI